MLSSRVLGPTRDEGMTELEVYARWLRSLPHHGRYRALSPHRSYDTPEEAYDRDSAPNLFAGELLTGMLDEVAPGLRHLSRDRLRHRLSHLRACGGRPL